MSSVERLSDVEAVLLTGGASRRMGSDKASLLIDGMPLAEKIAWSLKEQCAKVTVLGRDPIAGFAFHADSESYVGPRRALDAFRPTWPYVFVASCDMPFFAPEVVRVLRERIEGFDVAAPVLGDHPQPLCALYKCSLLGHPVEGENNMMSLIRRSSCLFMTSADIDAQGIRTDHLRSCNTADELTELMHRHEAS